MILPFTGVYSSRPTEHAFRDAEAELLARQHGESVTKGHPSHRVRPEDAGDDGKLAGHVPIAPGDPSDTEAHNGVPAYFGGPL